MGFHRSLPRAVITRYYVGGVYEVKKDSGGSVTKTTTYYPAAGAMRIEAGTANNVYYALKDHLGSASVMTDASGNVVGEQRFYLSP